jgi:hypothetical protein
MDWIKRNLYFLIGSAVAVALMGLAGWYMYSKWELNNSILGQLDEQYAKLKELNAQNPHPGSGEVDNIKAAKEERDQLRAFIEKARSYFQRIPSIPAPESGKVTSQEFSSALDRTIDHLQHDAGKANVTLPPKSGTDQQPYSFSFDWQKHNVTFAPGSLDPLSVQLGEIKAICDVLFEARINDLDYIRRERVSDDDQKGPQTDYVSEKSTTNELAVLSPYELGFRCFSGELSAVLAGFARSPYALLVKNINVELAPATTTTTPDQTTPAPATPVPMPEYRPPMPTGIPQAERSSAADAFARRYGLGSRMPAPAPQPAPVYVPPRTTPSRGGLPTALDEKQLKITMTVLVVKLTPPAK